MAPTRQKNAAPPPVIANGHDAAREDDTIIVEGADTGDGTAAEILTEDTTTEVDPGVAALQAQLDEQKRRADAAEAERDRLRNENRAGEKAMTDSRLLVIDSTITAKEAAKSAALQRKKDAKEAGDTDAEVAADDELQNLNIDLKTARLGKDRLEQQIEDAKAGPSEGDQIAEYTKGMPPRSANWIRDHADFVKDPDKNADLVAAHYSALGKKIVPNSQAYFEHIEQELGLRDAPAEQQQDEPEVKEERQQRAPSAPVSRGAAPGGLRSTGVKGITETAPGKYKVTPEIAEAAAMSGISVKEYVMEALKLERGSDGQLH